jgi:hypothetical protein
MNRFTIIKKFYNYVKNQRQHAKRLINNIDWGSFDNQAIFSSDFGTSRGTPIDRFYINQFLSENSDKITGKILEVESDGYAQKFGKVGSRIEVLSPNPNNSRANVIADLTDIKSLPHAVYDCFICTQTLNFIFNYQAAIDGVYRLLKPGGTALITVAGLTHISRYDMERWGDYWRFNSKSLDLCLSQQFNDRKITSYGNPKTAIGQIYGLCAEDYTKNDLDKFHADYQILISAIVCK